MEHPRTSSIADAGAPLEIDLIVPGNDVLIGDNGDDATTGEGGSDINVAGPGVDTVDGDFGFDWTTHRGSGRPRSTWPCRWCCRRELPSVSS